MRSLPINARIFLVAVWIAGTAASICAIYLPTPNTRASFWEWGLFLALGVAAGSKKVRLIRSAKDEDVGSMSLGYALTFAALLRLGPSAAVFVACFSNLSGCLYPTRQPIHQLTFNVALTAVETFVSSQIFLAVNGGTLDMSLRYTFQAVLASSLVYFLVNTGGVATIIALCSGQRPIAVWRQHFLWTVPSYFAGASVSTLAVLVWNNTASLLLFVSPVAYLTYQSYAIYTARAEEKQKHIEDLQVSQEQLADLYLATIKSLALAIDAKDQYTHQHILRVQRYAMATAQKLGLSGNDLEGLNTGALLHDIGKLGVPEYVLLKPGRLTDEEFAKIKKHPEIGAAILDPVPFPWPVLPVVKYHHEKWDGTGYPEGLKGEEIPLTARILAVADVYDALTSTRSYRNAWTHEKAVAYIRDEGGMHFDPEIVDAFVSVIDDVVTSMAAEGEGPLFLSEPITQPGRTKAEQAVRDIQRASSELWALYEVAQTLSSSLGLQETLDILARKLEAILPGTACLFLLKKESAESLEARAVVGVNREFFVGCRTVNDASLSLRVARDRESYMGPYNVDDLMLTGVETGPWNELRSALIVPIVHQGEVLGTINLYHPQPDAFGPHDMQLLEMISERAAMALYNGLLFDRTRSHAITDPLTGLYNVRYLTQHVEERCRRAHASPSGEAGPSRRMADQFALLCLDLDSFKPINDLFGHQKGDQVLANLGQVFQRTVRADDVVARYGGDEFLIVLDGAGPDEAEAAIAKLQRAVEEYDPGLIHARLGALRLGVSIGYGCYPFDGEDCATLLSAADSRMYAGKAERKLGQLADRARIREALADDGVELMEDLPVLPAGVGFV